MDEYPETQGLPAVLITAVGSLPHEDAGDAVDLILRSLSSAPHTPQLSRAKLLEQMWIQFSEGLPRFRVDLDEKSYFFDTSGDASSELERFYSAYLDVSSGGSPEAFAIGPEYGGGIHTFLQRLQQEGTKKPFIKVQVTGPLSFGLTVTDENGKPIFYHPFFRDVVVQSTGLKAAWLVDQFKPFAEEVIVFFDEPSLSAYGSSAFLGVSRDDVIQSLNEAFALTLDRGGIPGVHCCGNTDWSILMETATRIINFDAVDYMETIPLYATQLSQFLARGGALAWGAVPNDGRIKGESVDGIRRRLRDGIELLVKSGVDRALVQKRLIVTPACGCAGMTVAEAEMTYRLLEALDNEGVGLLPEQ
ncbi:MAG: hypothetical protein AB1473_08020 [Thermodesulfobacteriota bacterium]